MKTDKLTDTSNIGKSFIKYVSLNVMGMIGISCYILADTFFIAKGMGADGLTALNLAIPIYSMVHGFGLMIGIGGATKYNILKAQKKFKEGNLYFSNTLLMGISVGVLLILIGVLYSGNLSVLLGANRNTYAMTNTYLKTLLCFSPFFILNNVIICYIRNDGSPKITMVAMLVGSISNIILDYVFIFPMDMGIFGAAFATGLAPIISLGVLSIYFIRKKNNFYFIKCKINLNFIKNICLLGISSFITEISSGIVIIVFNILILSSIGNIGVAAYGILANLAIVVLSIFTGIAQGIQPIISSNYGKERYDGVYKILKYAVISSLVISVVIYVLTYFNTDGIIAIFNSDHNMELAALAKKGIRIYFLGFVFAGVNIILASFFSAIEMPVESFLISITRGFVAIVPLVFLLSYIYGVVGIWTSFPIAEILTFLVAICYTARKKSRKVLY